MSKSTKSIKKEGMKWPEREEIRKRTRQRSWSKRKDTQEGMGVDKEDWFEEEDRVMEWLELRVKGTGEGVWRGQFSLNSTEGHTI